MAGNVREPILGKGRTVTCPVCGWQMPRAEIRRRCVTCQSCKQRLRVQVPSGLRLISIGIGLLALLITYSLGVEGYEFLLVALIAYILTSMVVGAIGSWFFLKLERDIGADVPSGVLHLSGPPDSSSEPR